MHIILVHYIRQTGSRPFDKIPLFFWIIHRKIPEIFDSRRDLYKRLAQERKDFIKDNKEEKSLLYKLEKIKKRSVIFLTADALRKEGVYISRNVSYERTSQDYVRAYYSSPLMDEIRGFNHIVLRIGITAAIYS